MTIYTFYMNKIFLCHWRPGFSLSPSLTIKKKKKREVHPLHFSSVYWQKFALIFIIVFLALNTCVPDENYDINIFVNKINTGCQVLFWETLGVFSPAQYLTKHRLAVPENGRFEMWKWGMNMNCFHVSLPPEAGGCGPRLPVIAGELGNPTGGDISPPPAAWKWLEAREPLCHFQTHSLINKCTQQLVINSSLFGHTMYV